MFKNIVASTLLSLLLVCTVVSHQYLALTATEHNAVDTAWKRIEVTEDATTRLETALLNESQYREDVKERVCVEVVERLYELVVANDRKYQYYAYACQVESAAQSGSCTHSRETFYQCAMFDIRIYEQAWTRDVEVQSIEFSHGLSSPSEPEASEASGSADTHSLGSTGGVVGQGLLLPDFITAPSAAPAEVSSAASSAGGQRPAISWLLSLFLVIFMVHAH